MYMKLKYTAELTIMSRAGLFAISAQNIKRFGQLANKKCINNVKKYIKTNFVIITQRTGLILMCN